MGLLDRYRIDKWVGDALSAPDPSSQERRQAIAKLKEQRKFAVPLLLESLAAPESAEMAADLLAALMDDEIVELVYEGLSHSNARVVAGVVRLLSESTAYNPNRLLEKLREKQAPRAHLVEVLSHHKGRLDSRAVLRLMDSLDKDSQKFMFRLLDAVATQEVVPDLLPRIRSEDWMVRLSVVRLLRRFSTEAVRDALVAVLQDPHKAVRQAALEGLSALNMPIDPEPISKLLRDPDLVVQSKAIEAIIRIRDPRSVSYLLDLLQDESEYVRRAAVEVLNRVGDPNIIKELLNALRDSDWWVRVRAADALGTIGGPKVVDAILALIKDQDPFVRRSAIEILNMTKDERAYEHLIKALEDQDWWVRERAADALAGLGDKRAVPALMSFMEKHPEAAPVSVRALSTLGDPQAVGPLVESLDKLNETARLEALRALESLTDEQHVELVQAKMNALLQDGSGEIRNQAKAALTSLVSKFGARLRGRAVSTGGVNTGGGSSLLDSGPTPTVVGPEIEAAAPAAQESVAEEETPAVVPVQLIDATALQPGAVVGDRYRIIRRIGSGAFGVVLLVEDSMVHEEVILKFLMPHVAADERVIKRFIHELRYARRVTHSNVIRIYDFLTFGKSYAISMEYFHSHSLASEIKNQGGLNIPRALRIVRDICRGMAAAHEAGVVHRDLKPANILINDQDVVKIVDFGLAAAASQADPRITATGVLVGTPAYMAPEQVQSGTFDVRTDIYSLGVIMYELLTGKAPYTGPDPMSVLYRHLEGNPTPPAELRAEISPALQSIIAKAMALKPAERYQSADALREDVESLLVKEAG